VKPWQAIVFDLDDTLFPERQYVLSGFRAAAHWAETALGVPEPVGYAALERMFDAGIRGDTFNRWVDALGHPASLVPDLVRVYREHSPAVQPYPGVAELLALLNGQCKLGLVSDGYLAVQQAKVAALGLGHHFHAIVFSDEWGRDAWKPSARPFQELLARLDVHAEESVYVADNPLKDFFGARSVGMATVRTRHCSGDYSILAAPSPEYDADLTVDTLQDLKACLLAGLE
jgi:putative hydrolase of the HAD superfamily